METLKITKEIAIRAILHGACKIPKVGSLISEFSQSDLVWAEKMFLIDDFTQPLWTLSGSGSGSGYGSGYGSGDGSGDGDGSDDIGKKVLSL